MAAIDRGERARWAGAGGGNRASLRFRSPTEVWQKAVPLAKSLSDPPTLANPCACAGPSLARAGTAVCRQSGFQCPRRRAPRAPEEVAIEFGVRAMVTK